MRSKFMAKAAPKALYHVCRCFQRNGSEVCKFRVASPLLGSWPYQCIHRRDLVEARQAPQVRPWVFNGELLREQLRKKLKNNDLGKKLEKNDERLWPQQISHAELQKIGVEELRRLARMNRLDAFKRRIEQIPHEIISYRELLKVCMASSEQSSEAEAVAFAKNLDESGHILVLGQTVHLRPHKVARALEMVMEMAVPPETDRRSLELANLEDQKKKIDEEAVKRARAESWGGLMLFTVKTALLMRWTFWELSWDVMEPVCFFVTSAYVMAGYAFFLRTSTAPTFEGVFKVRFEARQRQIMKERNFDLERFQQLNTVFKQKNRLPMLTNSRINHITGIFCP